MTDEPHGVEIYRAFNEWDRRGPHWLFGTGGPRRPRLDAAVIVERAHAIVHDEGASALTMRALATSLGTSTSALYRRIPSKEWLLVAIVDHVFAEVELPDADGAEEHGREGLERLSLALRDVLSAHPHLHEVLASHVALTPNTVRIAEAALAGLRASGISDGDLVDAYNAWCGYVIGFTIIEAKPAEHVPDPNLQRAMRLQLELMTSNPTSLIRALMPDASNVAYGLSWLPGHLGGARSSFEWGLSALLDGFEAAERLSSTSGDVG